MHAPARGLANTSSDLLFGICSAFDEGGGTDAGIVMSVRRASVDRRRRQESKRGSSRRRIFVNGAHTVSAEGDDGVVCGGPRGESQRPPHHQLPERSTSHGSAGALWRAGK